jgi:hypothetical protein
MNIAGMAGPGVSIQKTTVSPQQKQISFTGQEVKNQQQVTRQREEKQLPGKAVDKSTPGGNFQVITGKDGRIGIKLTNISQNIVFSKLTTKELAEHLTKLNIPSTPENMKLAKSLLEFKMPLTRENLQDVKLALALMTKKTDGDLQAGAFMKLKSMNMTPENAKSLQSLFSQNGDMSKQMDQLQNMAKFFAASGRGLINDPSLAGLLSQMVGMFGDMMPKPQDGEKKIAKKLKDLAGEVGIDDEDGSVDKAKGKKSSCRGTLGKLKKKFEDKISKLKQHSGKDREDLLKETADLIDGLDENLEAQRLINNSPSVDDESFLYLQVPLKMPDNTTKTVHIKFEYEYDLNGQKFVNPKNTHIEFSIETEHMGIINIIMNLNKRRISCYFETENQKVRHHINRYGPELIKKFQDKAYKITDWDCNIEKKPVSFPQNLLEKEEFALIDTLDVTI